MLYHARTSQSIFAVPYFGSRYCLSVKTASDSLPSALPVPTDVSHIMKQTQLKFNKQTPFEETTISDTSSPLPLVTMIRGQTWWVGRAEDHYGSDKPSGTMRVHLSCAGFDAPGRALKEYKAPTFLVGNMLIGAFVCLSVCLCV